MRRLVDSISLIWLSVGTRRPVTARARSISSAVGWSRSIQIAVARSSVGNDAIIEWDSTQETPRAAAGMYAARRAPFGARVRLRTLPAPQLGAAPLQTPTRRAVALGPRIYKSSGVACRWAPHDEEAVGRRCRWASHDEEGLPHDEEAVGRRCRWAPHDEEGLPHDGEAVGRRCRWASHDEEGLPHDE